jgi:hypothetical protein
MLSLNCDPIALAVLGLGGVVVGMIELGLSFVRRFRTWKVSLALVAALALAGGAAYALGEGTTFGQPALVLAGASLALLLVRSRHSIAGRAVVQGCGLVLVSGALLGYAVYRLDGALESELLQSDYDLSLMSDPIEENSPPSLLARTDSGVSVPLFEPSPNAVTATHDVEARYLHELGLDAKLIQTAPPDLKYNCHGWVFTGGRYWVRSNQVQTILEGNGYRAVGQPQAGDLVVYRNGRGEVSHTGLVRAGGKSGSLLIESKWGRFGRYVHGPQEHGYRGHEATYYRTARGSHLLQGVDASRVSAEAEAAPSEE